MRHIECSQVLRDMADDLHELVTILSEEADDVSLLAVDNDAAIFTVSNQDARIEASPDLERGFVVRLLKSGRYFEYSFNDFTTPRKLAAAIIAAYERQPKYPSYDELEANTAMIYESSQRQVERDFHDDSPKDVLDAMVSCKERLFVTHENVKSVSVSYQQIHVSKAFFSPSKELFQGYMTSELRVSVGIQEGGVTRFDTQCKGGLFGTELLDSLPVMAERAWRGACELVRQKPVTPGVYDVIMAPDVSGLVAHEAFGHGVEMDMFVKNRALAKDAMNTQVASSLVTMIDGALPVGSSGSYLFDDEGNLGTQTILIKNGILVRGINDEATAQRLHVPLTGNGRRESFMRKAYTRMTNTYFAIGKDKLEDMIASIQDGFLLESAKSGMEDPKHWGVQCVIGKAREIKNGQLTGRLFGPVVLTGYVPELLGSVSMVGDRMTIDGAGFCGKGVKEFVKVSDGGPYMKARARLG